MLRLRLVIRAQYRQSRRQPCKGNLKMNAKPRILVDAIAQESKREPFWDELKRANAKRVNRVNKLRAVRATFDIQRFINTRNTCLKCDGSIMDIENEFWELMIHSESPVYFQSREAWNKHGDDARELLRYQAPNMPARVVSQYENTLRGDMLRAMFDAETSDYCAQFDRYLVRGIVDAIDAAIPTGAVWCWADSAGNPTTEYYECDSVIVAMHQRAATDGKCVIWEDYSGDFATRAERRDNAADALQEYVQEMAGEDALDPTNFDERGYRYGDRDAWPVRFIESSEAGGEWNAVDKAMRAKLRGMIANRAPLETRAALVATVYGNPGEVQE